MGQISWLSKGMSILLLAVVLASGCNIKITEPAFMAPPQDAYPSPVPPSEQAVWTEGQQCPNPDGLQQGELSAVVAVQIVEDFFSGEAELAGRVSDPAYWTLLPTVGRLDALSHDQISIPQQAESSPYAELLSTLCGEQVVEFSWWVQICPGPCAEAIARSPGLITHLFLIQRENLWMVWATYP